MRFLKSGFGLACAMALSFMTTAATAEQSGISDWGVNDATYGLKTRENEQGFSYTPSPTDWRDINIYQLFTDRFADSGEDQLGNYKPSWKVENHNTFPQNRNFHHGGDWKGLKNNLNYLQGMGVKALWISGVQQNDQGKDSRYTPYHQYHPDNFFKVDPAMGTFQDLKDLIDEIHARGMYVILDVVPNHMADKNGLANENDDKQYWGSGGPNFGWFDSNNKHPAPFDNLAYFHNNGTINNWDAYPEQVLGQFKGTDDLKTEDSNVQSILSRAFKNLIDATDCDGFRVDAIKHVEKSWIKQWADDMRQYAASRGKSDFLIFGEYFSYDNNALADFCKDEGYSFNASLFFPLSQNIANVFVNNQGSSQLTDQLNNKSLYGEAANRLIAFIDNHDVNRIALVNSGDNQNDIWKLRPALSFLYLATPVPCLYYGTEHAFDQGGHYNGSNKTEDNPDDGDWQRETMFDKGFQPGAAAGNKLAATNAPLYQHIAALNRARTAHPSLTRGSFQQRWQDSVYAFSRILDSEESLVVINIGDNNSATVTPSVGKPNGTIFVNALNPADTATVSGGKLSVSLTGKETKIYVAGSAIWARNGSNYPASGEIFAGEPVYFDVEAGPAGSVTNVIVSYSVNNGGTWSAFNMSVNEDWSSQDGKWYNYASTAFTGGEHVVYYFKAQGEGGAEGLDDNNGQNYAFDVEASQDDSLWVRGVKNDPVDGAATFATPIHVEAEAGPAGGVSSVLLVSSVDGGAWATNGMTVNSGKASALGDWYESDLGTFGVGTVLRYYVVAQDATNEAVANNGGAFYQVTIQDVGLAITNPAGNIAVANNVDTYTLQGTASAITTGDLSWTNSLTGAAGQFSAVTPWSLSDVALAVGANVITVSGSTGSGSGETFQDGAANYAGSWADNSNQGTGFGAWTFNHIQGSGYAGVFIGSPTNAGITGFSGNAFGFYANPPGSGANAEVLRSFAASMPVGSTFSFKWGVNWDSNVEGSYRGFSLFAGDTELVYINMANSSTININGSPMFSAYGTQAMTLHFEYLASGSLRVWGTGRDGTESYDQTLAVPAGAPTRFKFYFNATDSGEDHRQMYFDELALSTGGDSGETLSASVTITREEPSSDSNEDGVPDAWLLSHGLDVNTPASDVAPNGYTIGESYIMDLDPNDANTPPMLMEMTGNGAKPFTFSAPADGRRYMVQFTTNLFSPFVDIGENVDVGHEIEVNGNPEGYYRIRFYDDSTEQPGSVSVGAVPGSTTFGDGAGVGVTLLVSGVNVTTSTYSIDGGDPVSFTNGQIVLIGAGWTNGQSGVLTLYGSAGNGAEDTRSYTYTYGESGQIPMTHIAGTSAWVGEDNHVFIDSAGYPEGASVEAYVVYKINPDPEDTNAWPVVAMERNTEWENGDWWHKDLGILNNGDVVQFAVMMKDGTGTEFWDNNGGQDYSVTIGATNPPVEPGGDMPYSTNPTLGKRASKTIDGNPSDWSDDELIALGMANDDPRSLGDNWTMHEAPIDLTHMWAAWDDNNLYLAWQYVDVTDILDPANAGGAASGKISSNDGILQWIVLDTKSGGSTTDMWAKSNSWAGVNTPDVQIYLAGSLWQGYVSRERNGAFVVDDTFTDDYYKTIAAAGISVAKGDVFGGTSLWGVGDADNRSNQAAPDRNFLNEGHSTSRDSFFEMSIPLSAIGITAAQLDSGNGIGAMIGAGSLSAMDTLPHDEATLDTPGVQSYNSSFEWGDSDNFTSPFARIGH